MITSRLFLPIFPCGPGPTTMILIADALGTPPATYEAQPFVTQSDACKEKSKHDGSAADLRSIS